MSLRPVLACPARVGAEDRQRKLDELCRAVLRRFVGQDATPAMVARAEAEMRVAIDEAVRAGTYALPDGLVVDRVELGADMRLKVYFARAAPVGGSGGAPTRPKSGP